MSIKLPPMPASIEKLPRDERGYPVPWFVAWVAGKPEFRCADGRKFALALKERRCWVCGERTKRGKDNWPDLTFVLGPMCSITRTTAEPPCHYECAKFSAMACPFLTKPKATRRDAGLPEGHTGFKYLPGIAIERNPGVSALWRCKDYELFNPGNGVLFTVGEPVSVDWYAEGRKATRSECMESIESGLPILMGVASKEGAESELLAKRNAALVYLPAQKAGAA